MTNSTGTVTLAKSYDPYGAVTHTNGAAQSAYGFTGEMADVSGLTYLRARYYSPLDGRFMSKDPSRLESNLYAYARSNPVNFTDPTGLLSKEAVIKNVDASRFFASSTTKDHSNWGFYALLRKAEDGDRVSTEYTPLGTGREIWSTPEPIRMIGCDKIMVGDMFLSEYYDNFINKSYEPVLWWRDTTPSQYQLHKNSSPPIYTFWDGFDNDVSTYPHFVGVSVGTLSHEFGYLVDFQGNKYLSVSFGPPGSFIVGIGYIEGYLCDWSLTSYHCSQGLPSASEVQSAISGICLGSEAVALVGFNLGAFCKDWGWNVNFTSSVFTFYAGEEVGEGDGVTLTFPLAPFGVPTNPREGWMEIIIARRQHGMTWSKISAGGLW